MIRIRFAVRAAPLPIAGSGPPARTALRDDGADDLAHGNDVRDAPLRLHQGKPLALKAAWKQKTIQGAEVCRSICWIDPPKKGHSLD